MVGLKVLKLQYPSKDAAQQERWVRIFSNTRKVLLLLGHPGTKDGLMFAQGDQKAGKSVAQLQQLRAGDALRWRELVVAMVSMTEDLGAEVRVQDFGKCMWGRHAEGWGVCMFWGRGDVV